MPTRTPPKIRSCSSSLVLILTLLNGNFFPAYASLFEVAFQPATAFYKTPESLFVSGYASKNDLLAQTRQSYTEFNFEAAIGSKTLNVQNEQILREINVAWKVKIKKASPLYMAADLNSPQLLRLNENQLLEIQSLQGAFARVRHSAGKMGYVLTSSLDIVESDPGHWVNIAPLSLKSEPKANAKQLLLIPALSRFTLLKIQSGFGLIQAGSYQGYASMTELIGRVDFAEFGWDNSKKVWERIRYRDGLSVIVSADKRINLNHFRAFRGSKNRALISGEHSALAKGTRIDLVKPQAIRWTQSEVKGHGLIWWRRDLLSDTIGIETITTAELLKKKLSGISYDSKTKKGLASAGGIYKTTDGKNWKRVRFFGNDDWPVCIHPAGVWFVGTFRSTDEGKTFEPSLKYTDLARLLQNSGNRNRAFIHLKVLDLEPLPKSHVMMKIDTGVIVAKLKSHVLSNQWILIP